MTAIILTLILLTGTLGTFCTAIKNETNPSLAFSQIETQVRENNLSMLACQESIASLDAFDKYAAYGELQAGESMGSVLEQQVSVLREQLDSLEDEEYEESYQRIYLQLDAMMNQVIIGTQHLFFSILSLEQTLLNSTRNLETLGRMVEEIQLRYSLGQVSQLQLLDVQMQYTNAKSQIDSLSFQIANLKAQLQFMLGQAPTGELALTMPSAPTQSQLDEMNLDGDLPPALAANPNLILAQYDVEESKEAISHGARLYQKEMAQHTYNATLYTTQAMEQSFVLNFGIAYRTVFEKQQLLEASKDLATFNALEYESMALKHQLGTISEEQLLTAQSSLDEATYRVKAAELELFTSYQDYQWALIGYDTISY